MTDTHNEPKEAFQQAINDLAVYRDQRIGTCAITSKSAYVNAAGGSIAGPSYQCTWTLDTAIKAVLDAWLDGTALPPVPVPPGTSPPNEPPSDPNPPSDPPDDPPADPPPDDGDAPPDAAAFVPRAFAASELHWSATTTDDTVDVTITLDTGEVLTCTNAPLGVTPLKRADGTPHPLSVVRYIDCVRVENAWLRNTQQFTGRLVVAVNGATVCDEAGVQFWLWHSTPAIRGGLPQIPPIRPAPALFAAYGDPGEFGDVRPAGNGPYWGPNGRGYEVYDDMASAGGRTTIGLLPNHDLPWLVRGEQWDRCREANDYALVWDVCVRDDVTGLPAQAGDYHWISMVPQQIGSGTTAENGNPIKRYGSCQYRANAAHQTHFGAVAYASTGSDYDLECLLFWGGWNQIQGNAASRKFEQCITGGAPRQVAWTLTTWGYCAKLLPDAHPHKATYRAILQRNAEHFWTNQYAPGKPKHNIFGAYCSVEYVIGGKKRGIAPWQNDYLTSALNLLVHYGFDEYTDWRDFCANGAVARMRDCCYQFASAYEMCVVDPATYDAGTRDNPATWYTTWDAVRRDTYATNANYRDQVDVPCGQQDLGYGVGMMIDSHGDLQGGVARLRPALAAAVDAGLPDAQAMWDKMVQFGGTFAWQWGNEHNIVPRAA